MTDTDDRQVNIPLLRKAVEWAEAEAAKPPELCEWDQNYWVLPSSPDDPNAIADLPAEIIAMYRRDLNESCGTVFCVAGWTVHSAGEKVRYHGVGTRAAELLGLSENDADRLFDSDNTIADVRRIAEEIAGERL